MKKIKLLPAFIAFVPAISIAPTLTSCKTTQYTVHFETNGGSAIADVKVKKGSKLTEPQKPTKENCEFGGWFKDQTLKNGFNFKEETITSDITLYAKWDEIGFEVNEAQWKSAFLELADTRKEQYFWTDGQGVLTSVNKTNGNVTIDSTDQIIFNGSKHYAFTNSLVYDASTEKTKERTTETAGEYLNGFFYTGWEQEDSSASLRTFDISYKTYVTDFFYRAYTQAKDIFGKVKFDNKGYGVEGDDFSLYVIFNKDLKIQTLQYVDVDTTDKTYNKIRNIDLTFNYGKKDFDLPEGWDDYKEKSSNKWIGDDLTSNFYKGKLPGTTLYIDNISSTQAGAKSLRVYNEKGDPITNFADNALMACITRKDAEMPTWVFFDSKTDWDKTNKCWNISELQTTPLAEGDSISFAIRYNYIIDRPLQAELIK